jgi:hypothetical protein
MTTLAPPSPAPTRAPTPGPPAAPRRRRRWVIALGAVVAMICLAPVVLLAGAGNPPCSTTGVVTPGGASPSGMFAAPLTLRAGRWYQVGATEYGGPGDPSSGTHGSEAGPGGDLLTHPDSFAELSLLDTNPANTGTFTFSDANALGTLPYNTALRVRANGQEKILYKRDIGYGQGPGQTIPYRIDVWWQAAAQLGISKNPVNIELAPSSGSGGLLGQLPTSAGGPAAGQPSGCGSTDTGEGPLPITDGPTAQIDPATGQAAAPANAPAAVKRVIAAANQIIDKPYIWGGGHADLDALAGGYDCSAAVEYALHQAGLYAPTAGPSSTAFESYGQPGPGRWITIYANADHMWAQIAGVVLNTAHYAPVVPTTPSSGPRWQPASTAQEQIAGNTEAGYPAFVVTHPPGL